MAKKPIDWGAVEAANERNAAAIAHGLDKKAPKKVAKKKVAKKKGSKK